MNAEYFFYEETPQSIRLTSSCTAHHSHGQAAIRERQMKLKFTKPQNRFAPRYRFISRKDERAAKSCPAREQKSLSISKLPAEPLPQSAHVCAEVQTASFARAAKFLESRVEQNFRSCRLNLISVVHNPL